MLWVKYYHYWSSRRMALALDDLKKVDMSLNKETKPNQTKPYPQRAAYLVVFKISVGRSLQNLTTCLKDRRPNSMPQWQKFNGLPPWSNLNCRSHCPKCNSRLNGWHSTLCLHDPISNLCLSGRNSTDSFSKYSNSQDHLFRAWCHPHSSPISCLGALLWQMVIVISFAHERKTATDDDAPGFITRIVQSLT